MNSRHISAVLLLGFAPLSLARDTSEWTNLELLKPGQSIGIIQANLKRVEGQFERVTDVAITLRAEAQVTLGREEVIRV
jgi:hypothetical protein